MPEKNPLENIENIPQEDISEQASIEEIAERESSEQESVKEKKEKGGIFGEMIDFKEIRKLDLIKEAIGEGKLEEAKKTIRGVKSYLLEYNGVNNNIKEDTLNEIAGYEKLLGIELSDITEARSEIFRIRGLISETIKGLKDLELEGQGEEIGKIIERLEQGLTEDKAENK